MTMRFLADESCDFAVVRALGERDLTSFVFQRVPQRPKT